MHVGRARDAIQQNSYMYVNLSMQNCSSSHVQNMVLSSMLVVEMCNGVASSKLALCHSSMPNTNILRIFFRFVENSISSTFKARHSGLFRPLCCAPYSDMCRILWMVGVLLSILSWNVKGNVVCIQSYMSACLKVTI